jgi:hypothetical protein
MAVGAPPALLPQLGGLARMSSRQHAPANAGVASRPAAFHNRPDVAATRREVGALSQQLGLTAHPPRDKRPAAARRTTQRRRPADELVLDRLQALKPGEKLSDELVIAHLRAELRRLQALAVSVSDMARQADERASWLRAEIVRGEAQLRTRQDAGAELVELSKQNRSLHLDLDTALQNEQQRAQQTLAKLSAEGVRQVVALSSGAMAQMLALLSHGSELAPDVLAMNALRQAQPTASDTQVVRYLRAEVRRQATELSHVLIQERRVHKCVAEAEGKLNSVQAQRLQQLGGTDAGTDAGTLKKIAVVSAQNALLRRMVQQPTNVLEAAWYEPAAAASNDDRATAVELLHELSPEDKETLRLSEHRWAQPFVRAVQSELERGQMIYAATRIAAVMRGKAARARARSVRTKLRALDAFMDGLVGNEEDSDEENLGAGTCTSVGSVTNVDLHNEVDSESDTLVVPSAVSWAEQMVLGIGLQVEQEEEQAAVRIQAITRGKLARNTLRHT